MRAMFAAFACTILIAVIAEFALDEVGFSSQERTTADSVRLD